MRFSKIGPSGLNKEFRFMKKVFAVVFILLAAVTLVRADTYIKSKYHSDAMAFMGQNQPAKDEIYEQWIGTDKFANLTPDMSIILDFGKNKAVIINHKDKTYVETTLPLDMAKLVPPEMAGMMGMMKPTVAVQPANQNKTIGQWPCSLYNVTISMMGMPMKMAVWASEKVPFDLSFYQDKIFSAMMKGTLRLDDASVAEMKKVKGYFIANDVSMEMMGAKIHTSQEVVEISQKTPGPAVYAVPAGYTKAQYISMQR
jgi:hypothetical protein